MRYRFLGRSGLLVSEIGLGTNTFGGQGARWEAFGALGQSEATAVMRTAIECGINLIDTGNTYGEGESEQRVGQALRDLGVARHEVHISTKVYGRMGPAANSAGASRANILSSVEDSLRRLKTDYLDLYLIHSFDSYTPIEETLRTMDDLVRQGKVRYPGCSNFAAWQVTLALGTAERLGLTRLAALEAMYAVAARDIEREILPMIQHQQVGLIVWGALAGGLLTGKYDSQGRGDGRHAKATFHSLPGDSKQRALAVAEAMKPIAQKYQVNPGNIAVAWLPQKPLVSSVILGAKRPEQVRDSVKALDLLLGQADMAQLDKLAPLTTEYPQFMQDAMSARRMPEPHKQG
jgi:aryl-alcohol dehydrogenase-like predicted oxidoreductase